MNSKFHKTYLLNWKNDYNSLGAKYNNSFAEKQAIVIFYTPKYQKHGKPN